MHNDVTFEQPISEHIRICLRIEHLLNRIEANILGETEMESRIALEAILEMVNVVDRPDMRSKITKALAQQATFLTQFEQQENVDHARLQATLLKLDELIDNFYSVPDIVGQQLRNNPFLSSIRQHMANPGGACPFGTPAYYLWLQQPVGIRTQHLLMWFSIFEKLKVAVELLLQLTRGSREPEWVVAEHGFYQCAIDSRFICHLARVSVPLALNVYPEISLSRHRLMVRFLDLNIKDKATQRLEDIAFRLVCCS